MGPSSRVCRRDRGVLACRRDHHRGCAVGGTAGGWLPHSPPTSAHRGPAGRLRAVRQRHRDHLRLEVHRQWPRRPPSPASTATNKRRSRRPPDCG